ncbi:MAG TPA: hypothetical protein VKC66_20010 [Xanthobacteraceae bacterium]|nr:hypothetical protein [Xanthobacteraceae bacterium]
MTCKQRDTRGSVPNECNAPTRPCVHPDLADRDELAEGKLTSNITVSAGPPYNAEGLVRPDHSIEWSNGTKWVKQ